MNSDQYQYLLEAEKSKNRALEMQLSDSVRTCHEAEEYVRTLEEKLRSMEQSASWKITKPMRGLKQAGKKDHAAAQTGEPVSGFDDMMIGEAHIQNSELETLLRDISEQESVDKRIAVHLHLFYTDLLEEFAGCLAHIPFSYHLFVSCPSDADTEYIRKRFKRLRQAEMVTVAACENRGRDIAPFYVLFGKKLQEYDYLLHIHSKKSLFTGAEKTDWRQYSLYTLLGNESLVRKIFYLFETEHVGLIYPDQPDDLTMLAYSWIANETEGKAWMERLGLSEEREVFMYPAGSFFWVRTDAIRPLFEQNLTLEDFEPETGQHDHTLAHVLERILPFVVRSQGYGERILDIREGLARKKSRKPFREYLSTDADELCRRIETYDVVSFDLTDTLVTCCVPDSGDRKRIADAAAVRVSEDSSCGTALHGGRSEKETADEMRVRLTVPRGDMKYLYHAALTRGQTVLVVCGGDTDRQMAVQLLQNCGYEHPDAIYISGENGHRKEDGTLWDEIFAAYEGRSFIHFGSSVEADWRAVTERNHPAIWLMRPGDAYVQSAFEEKFSGLLPDGTDRALYTGLAVGGGLFNSPFADYTDTMAKGGYANAFELGFGCFGPLLTGFAAWVHEQADEDGVIMFPGRKGIFLKKLYENWCRTRGICLRQAVCPETSRRALGAAASADREDVRRILSLPYEGSLGNLLKSRFGEVLPDGWKNRQVRITGDAEADGEILDVLMKELEPVMDGMLARFSAERREYTAYLAKILPEHTSRFYVVDLGFGGSAQRYLSQLMDREMTGLYLAGRENREVISPSRSLYTQENPFFETIRAGKRFLEIALQAPCRKLEFFRDGVPVYTGNHYVSDAVRELQSGILRYCELSAVYGEQPMPPALAQEMFARMLEPGRLSGEIESSLLLEDRYGHDRVIGYHAGPGVWA